MTVTVARRVSPLLCAVSVLSSPHRPSHAHSTPPPLDRGNLRPMLTLQGIRPRADRGQRRRRHSIVPLVSEPPWPRPVSGGTSETRTNIPPSAMPVHPHLRNRIAGDRATIQNYPRWTKRNRAAGVTSLVSLQVPLRRLLPCSSCYARLGRSVAGPAPVARRQHRKCLCSFSCRH